MPRHCLLLSGYLLLVFAACGPQISAPPVVPASPDAITLAKTLKLPVRPYSYPNYFELPGEIADETNYLDSNLVLLGRVLFYDKALSIDNTVSCASCHQQSLGFADHLPFSEGIHGNVTDRNSLSLASFVNFSSFYFRSEGSGSIPRFFWDERAEDTRSQILETLANEKEMGMTPETLPDKLQRLPYYQILWDQARKSPAQSEFMETQDILEALESFMFSLQSTEARFDIGYLATGKKLNLPFPNFSPSENRGKALFMAHCISCHGPSLGVGIRIAHSARKVVACNGLDQNYDDKGVGKYQQNPSQYGVFKIPGLRNIAQTAPYMHDGRFKTLEEVIQHYNAGIQAHPNLDNLLRDDAGQPVRLGLSEKEVQSLADFLTTLSDENLLKHPKWSNPFR